MKIGAVARSSVNRVHCRVDKSERLASVGNALLVGESEQASPHRSCEAGSTIQVSGTSCLIGANVEGEICVCRDVRAVAQRLRALCTTRGASNLIGRNGKLIRRE